MTFRSALLLSLALLAVTAQAQTGTGACDLAIAVSCSGGTCTAVTTNNGSVPCNGNFITGFVAQIPSSQIALTGLTSTLGNTETCIDNNILPTTTEAFAYCVGNASLPPLGSFTSMVSVATTGAAPASVPIIGLTVVLAPVSNEEFAYVYGINTVTTPTCTPAVTVPPVTQSGVPYNVVWSQVAGQNTSYSIDESTAADFSANLSTQQVTGTTAAYNHTVAASTAYYYRVRSTACGQQQPGPYSANVQIIVQAPPPTANVASSSRGIDTILPLGAGAPYSFPLFIPGPSGKTAPDANTSTPYSVSVDKTYITASPTSGTVGANGATVTVTVNPSGLPPGASTGTVNVTNSSSGQTIGNVPVSVSLVTPVTPAGKTLPPGNALIIPVVTHVNGANSPFQSDVRITNANAASTSYQITFTPTLTDGTQSSKSTQITIPSGQTIALNDIAKDFFGYGASGNPNDTGFGSLEIRPLNTTSTLTYASSRTYATTSAGTLGQFVPATPFAKFGTRASLVPGQPIPPVPVLSLQQIAQSAKFRTNLGIVEGSGAPASGNITIFDDTGAALKTVPYSLLAGEHQQLNQFLAAQGITLNDGRIEITVESSTGAVFAYASVLDNITSDPLAVSPVQVANVSATTWVIPGMADLPGTNNFHSDLRVYNGGSSSVTTTATFYPQGNGTPIPSHITIPAGGVTAIDNVLPTTFNTTGTGGSVVLTTSSPAKLVATGRTYSIRVSDGGTFGQFIPGVSPADGIGVGDKPLQVLQLEESQNFRSNLGMVELTGNPAHVKLSLFLPDSKVIPTVEYDLAPYQFLQIGRIMASLNPGQPTYNGRISVQVTSGTGRVTAYGSVIDNVTQDPTYVPAQ